MNTPIKVTDLVTRSLDEMTKANRAAPQEAARFERNASTFAELATAQSAKTANIIAYLNSDRSRWSKADEEVVRVMLGLPTIGGDEGGADESAPETQAPSPEQAAAVTALEETATTPAVENIPEPVFAEVEEPTFA